MARRGHLNVPVIGVAKAGWTLDQLRARAQDSVEKHGGLDRAAFAKLCATASLRRRRLQGPGDLRGAPARRSAAQQHPAHYLAIPPPLFGPVVEQLAQSGCAKGARVVVEKPFGQDLASARELNRILLGTFVERRHLPHRPLPRQAARPQHAVLPLREPAPRGVLEPHPRRERADHDGGGLRHPGPRRLLRRDRRHPRRRPEPPVPGAEQSGDGAAGADGQRVAARREGEGAEVHSGARGRATSCADSSAATAQEPGVAAGLAGRDVRRDPAPHRVVAMAGRAVLHPRREVPAGHRPRRSSSGCAGRRRGVPDRGAAVELLPVPDRPPA